MDNIFFMKNKLKSLKKFFQATMFFKYNKICIKSPPILTTFERLKLIEKGRFYFIRRAVNNYTNL